jgi:predicted Zn-dependent protease
MNHTNPTQSGSATIQGVVSHESLPTGRAFAKLTVTLHSLLAQADGNVEIELPLKGLTLSWGGANNKLLFLMHPNYPGWTIFTRDRSLLSRLQATGVADLSHSIQELHQARHRLRRRSFIILASLVAAVWGISILWKPFVATCASLIPFSWEKKLGDAVFVGVKTQTVIISDDGLRSDFSKLLEPLTTAVGERAADLEFYIAKSEDLNAFAIPGGKIIVNSRTILDAARPEELYGVLAHEISHVTLRHTARQIITVFGVYTAVDLVLGNIFGTVAAVTQGASYLLQQGFSRDQEREADQQGLAYLLAANIDPKGAVEFFQRIERDAARIYGLSELEKSLSFLSTHPETNERIAELTRQIEAEPQRSYRLFSAAEFDAFKERLREKLKSS